MVIVDATQFFQKWVRTCHYKRCIEVSTLSGYTVLVIALAVSHDGQYIRRDTWEKNGC
jgi:predicted O-methyltransferase YrrM